VAAPSADCGCDTCGHHKAGLFDGMRGWFSSCKRPSCGCETCAPKVHHESCGCDSCGKTSWWDGFRARFGKKCHDSCETCGSGSCGSGSCGGGEVFVAPPAPAPKPGEKLDKPKESKPEEKKSTTPTLIRPLPMAPALEPPANAESKNPF
jgi:hypothetical protein